MNGIAGTILRIDLTSKKISKEPTRRYSRHFIGGRGINAKIFYDETKPGQKAFDPDTPLIFGAGALVGTGAPCSPKVEATTRSAYNDLLGHGAFGGYWGAELKYAGYDNIVIKGKSEKPVYIWIDNESVEIRDADWLWGKDTFETTTEIRERLGDPDIQVVCIGPAGDKLVRSANIKHGTHGVTRAGAGAVMGSKKLKAIAVRGTSDINIAEPEKFLEACEKLLNMIKENEDMQFFAKWGVSYEIEDMFIASDYGLLGNFETHVWPQSKLDEARGRPFVEKYAIRQCGCHNCPVHCMHYFSVPGVRPWIMKCAGYMSPTTTCWNPSVELAFEAVTLCDKYGIGHDQAASYIAFLMQLYREGIITDDDTDGIPMERGSKEAIFAVIHKIAKREGIGNILAETPTYVAKKIGKGVEKYLIHKRNVFLFQIDFRIYPGNALTTAIASRDMIHNGYPAEERSWSIAHYAGDTSRKKELEKFSKEMLGTEKAVIPWEYEGKAKIAAHHSISTACCDMLGFCKFVIPMGITPSVEILATLYSAATGIRKTEKELLETAREVYSLERTFLGREGITRKDDMLPEFFFTVPVPDGREKGRVLDRDKFEKMKDEFYEAMGWDVSTGLPKKTGATK